MTWTLCTSGAAIHHAGRNANSTLITSGSALADYSDEAEAFLCTHIRYDVVTNYGNLTSNGKKILSDTAADLIAEKIVRYDTNAYFTGEATLLLNVIENNIIRNLKLLEDDKYKGYLAIT